MDSVKGKQGVVTLENHSKAQLIYLSDNEGNHFLPIFTDWSELSKWNKEKNIQTLILKTSDYQFILNDNSAYAGVVINPYGENVVLPTNRLNSILGHTIEMKKGTSIKIGEPAKKPTKLIKALCDFFPETSSIRSAYLLYMVKENEESFLLVIDTDEPQVDFPRVAQIGSECLEKGELLDLIPLSDSFGAKSIDGMQPFYKL